MNFLKFHTTLIPVLPGWLRRGETRMEMGAEGYVPQWHEIIYKNTFSIKETLLKIEKYKKIQKTHLKNICQKNWPTRFSVLSTVSKLSRTHKQ